MNKFYYVCFISIIAIAMLGCSPTDYDYENDDYWKKEAERDFKSKFEATQWVTINAKDSIIIKFSYGLTIYNYDASDGKLRYYDSYYQGEIRDKKLYLHNSKGADKKVNFDLSGSTLKLYGLIDNKDYVFYKMSFETAFPDKNILTGTWTTTSSRDSTAWVFENEALKEYIYDKNTGSVLKFTDYHSYYIIRDIAKWSNRQSYKDELKATGQTISMTRQFTIENNKLKIHTSGEPIIFTKE